MRSRTIYWRLSVVGGEKGLHSERKGGITQGKQGCHTVGREGRIKAEAVGEIMDGVLEGQVDERSIAKDEHDQITAQ